jgi:hypothetical protein
VTTVSPTFSVKLLTTAEPPLSFVTTFVTVSFAGCLAFVNVQVVNFPDTTGIPETVLTPSKLPAVPCWPSTTHDAGLSTQPAGTTSLRDMTAFAAAPMIWDPVPPTVVSE